MKRPACGIWILAAVLAMVSLLLLNITVANSDHRVAVRAGVVLAAASMLTALIAAWRARWPLAARALMLLPFLAVLTFAALDATRRFGSIPGVFR